MNSKVEIYFPSAICSGINTLYPYEWLKERGYSVWKAFGPKSRYPFGIRYTPLENIVWLYTAYLP